ncbi:MAG: DNA (cytosine-5-)-methyltransferase [Gammaproteobacteria bacterium]|nr:DNA (cytosine-5-)-methyltransferase [Gammaproteobacteria bacterium]
MHNKISVIDLFAGPGGLGEGFASFKVRNRPVFDVRLSIESARHEYQTLFLRSFFREFDVDEVPDAYYENLRENGLPLDGRIEKLINQFPRHACNARNRVCNLKLGENTTQNKVMERIDVKFKGPNRKVLIGGPPCQAYSLAGRSRNRGNSEYMPEKDERQHLYVEYLQVVADHAPHIFVMENVKGLLSATLNNQKIFERILDDLQNPSSALKREGRKIRRPRLAGGVPRYRIHSLTDLYKENSDLRNFIVPMEKYGIPQARHRVILIGIREDMGNATPDTLVPGIVVPAENVLFGLPRLRSGLSKEEDSDYLWKTVLQEATQRRWFKAARNKAGDGVYSKIRDTVKNLALPRKGRGGEFVNCNPSIKYRMDWFIDPRIKGVFNHSARSHIKGDLYRYLYASCYAQIHKKSPGIRDFPKDILPDHKNVHLAMNGGMFADRFRVQVESKPATTITCHISRDGHYYIHPNPSQCRSLTVREAARIQTFPDSYFFCGPRTAQYIQVGNAVPPLLSCEIAKIVYNLLK